VRHLAWFVVPILILVLFLGIFLCLSHSEASVGLCLISCSNASKLSHTVIY
jgi:hypothetical protein